MNDVHSNLQFEQLCHFLQLGELVGTPEAVSGGLLHKMFAVETSQGKYAIKALNPQIMRRPEAMQNFVKSEKIANIAAKSVPAHPAKMFNGSSVQEFGGQFFLVFDWIDGQSLKRNEIHDSHCEKIGAILADIHRTDFADLGAEENNPVKEKLRDWNAYLRRGQENDAVWVSQLLEIKDQLYAWNTQAYQSARWLESGKVISHGDLEPKNVMWNQGNPVIIDWESAGFIHPMQDLAETAIYWSGDGKGNLDKAKFKAFVRGYRQRNGTLQANWKAVLVCGFLGKLGWLEYSLKRSLWMECTDEEEQQMGTSQVTGTINAIRRYADRMAELEQWLTMAH